MVGDGRRVLFLRSGGPEDPVTCLWELDVASGAERLLADPAELLADTGEAELPPAERARRERAREGAAGIVGYSTDSSGERVVFALAGQAYLRDAAGVVRQLDTAPGVFDPRLSPDGSHVAYVVGNTLQVVAVAEGSVGVVVAAENDETVSWGSAEFIAAEEMRRSRGYWWSPDSRSLVVARADVSSVSHWHIADPARPWSDPTTVRYPAAGTANAEVSLTLFHLPDGVGGGPVRGPEIDWDRSAHPYLVDVSWRQGEVLTVVVSSRDQRSMRVLAVDPDTGVGSTAGELTDPDWVEIVPGTPRWVGSELLTVREHDGTRALLLGDRTLSGPGQWVRDVVAVRETEILYTASTDPTEVRLMRVGIDPSSGSSGPADADVAGGVVSAVAAEEATVTTVARLDGPTEVTVVVEGRRLPIASRAASPLVDPDVELFRAGRREIETAVLFPRGAAADEPLPILLDPYGGPHAQRVMRSRNMFLASQWFADQGFCVVVADGRGTPGRGGGWERAVRGDLAAPVLEDQVAALDAVVARHGDRVDPDRVGIRGWSFGGYLAALAVLRRPDRFHAAVAGAPVTDWRWYDTHYTERYLGHPDEEPDNYERTSLIRDAAALERPLMLIHGLADDNVVAAHTLQLSSALLAAGRPHEVLPLSGVTHMTPQEEVAENLLLLQVEFLARHLGRPGPPIGDRVS